MLAIYGSLIHCRWLSIRLECLGALAALSAALLAIEQRGKASGMGLTLSYALSITMLTSITVRLASVAENSFNAGEAWGCLYWHVDWQMFMS